MRVMEFDTSKGLYAFQFKELETAFHSHPAIEVLLVEDGSIKVCTEDKEYERLSLAVINANVKHKVSGKAESIKAVMIEHQEVALKEKLASFDIILNDHLYVSSKEDEKQIGFENLYQELIDVERELNYDPRISRIIHYLYQNDVAYESLMDELTPIVSLSESRLSHLFKENVGISLKKYLLWCKLKATISKFLDEKEDLFSALIQSGFYDQPHFSKAFKTMLGVKPSHAYNSRTVQF